MNEIEKMYENTIGKQSYCTANDCLDMSKCKNCYFCKQFYPPFTADKVLKVIVFFLNKGIRLDFSIEENIKVSVKNFKEYIAQIVSKYWQDLTLEEKQQVKEILNDR